MTARHLIGRPGGKWRDQGWATYCGITGLKTLSTVTGFPSSVTCEACLTSARVQGHIP
jgi:hypothetical protein